MLNNFNSLKMLGKLQVDKKCMANCMAQSKIQPHLWLRNNVFYCRIELSRVGGKRRYLCYSLHTNSYYEALGKMNEIPAKKQDILDKYLK